MGPHRRPGYAARQIEAVLTGQQLGHRRRHQIPLGSLKLCSFLVRSPSSHHRADWQAV
ncbi:hypothetical protein PGN35_007865 [Nodosilinea sp. PGN35]|uniref:hypothetical protein n=1 Tax=Nodosilinea sp. PGN35 TaxID=3020489 RepID=UPI00398BAB36